MMSVLLWACAGNQAAEPLTAAEADRAEEMPKEPLVAEVGPKQESAASEAKAKASSPIESAPSSANPTCTPIANAEPKVVAGEASVSDVADTGHALIFEIAGISLELPACTPEADAKVITVSWDTKDRPNATRIGPSFSRHAATLRVDQAITALEGRPLLVRLHSKRELAKPGEKLVLAVETSGECDAAHKRDKLPEGDCSHWQLFDASFDPQRNEMVARIPSVGGYRLQFGWVSAK